MVVSLSGVRTPGVVFWCYTNIYWCYKLAPADFGLNPSLGSKIILLVHCHYSDEIFIPKVEVGLMNINSAEMKAGILIRVMKGLESG